MFRRVLLDNWMAIFPLVAFLTAATVYVIIAYKTFRMQGAQANRFAQLPFNDQPATSHDAEA